MVAATSPGPVVDESAEPIPKRSDTTKAIRLVFLRHLAHEGIMLDKINRQIRRAERMEQFAVSGDPKDLKVPPEDESMGVNLGNEKHFHITMPAEEKATPPPPAPTPATPGATNPITGLAVPLLCLLLGGGSVALLSWLNKPPPPPVTNPPVATQPHDDSQNFEIGVTVQDHP